MAVFIHARDCVCDACLKADRHGGADAIRARADAAEQLLAGVLRSLEIRDRLAVVTIDNPGLASWWADWQAKHDTARRIADLTARRDRERAALDATERELEAIATTENAPR